MSVAWFRGSALNAVFLPLLSENIIVETTTAGTSNFRKNTFNGLIFV